MTTRTAYRIGGFDPDKPYGNASELWDDDTGTYTRLTDAGTVELTRPLTPDEAADLATSAPAEPATPDLPTLADQVQQLTDAVDLLILSALEF